MAVATIEWNISGQHRYPTSEGGWLELSGDSVTAELALRYEYRDPEEDVAHDLIACDVRIPDSQGQIWSATSRFSTEVFVVHMFDLSRMSHMDLFHVSEADEKYQEAFRSGVMLEGARFWSDDRFYRTILLRNEPMEIQFKDTCIKFDVAVVQDSLVSPTLTKLAVKIQDDCLFDDDQESLGELGYFMSCEHLLRHNTVRWDAATNEAHVTPIPLPLVFSPVVEAKKPRKRTRSKA